MWKAGVVVGGSRVVPNIDPILPTLIVLVDG